MARSIHTVRQAPGHDLQDADPSALERRRDALCQRLEEGYLKIERGLAEGKDVTTWEDLWIALLREYEQICDDLTRKLAA